MRLADSLPKAVLQQLQLETAHAELAALRAGYAGETSYARQKRYFGRFDSLLDGTQNGPTWLSQAAVAAVVTGSIHAFLDYGGCQLVCYCVMSNHLHLVVVLDEQESSLMRKLQRFKSYTAIQANRVLNRNGQFWHRESYDHIIRDAPEMERVVAYVLNNPVKAGIVKKMAGLALYVLEAVILGVSWGCQLATREAAASRYIGTSVHHTSASISHRSFNCANSFFTCSNFIVASFSCDEFS